jgi:hypothetical protein
VVPGTIPAARLLPGTAGSTIRVIRPNGPALPLFCCPRQGDPPVKSPARLTGWLLVAVIVLTIANAVPAAAAAAPDAPAAARPNVLWITCEDISPDLGCYGVEGAITPNLDRLAAGGIRYTHAFALAGVCAVSRSCIVTGMYSSSLGSQGMRSRTSLHSQPTRPTIHSRADGQLRHRISKASSR